MTKFTFDTSTIASDGACDEGKWELRPHKERLIRVDDSLLAQWQRLTDSTDTPVDQLVVTGGRVTGQRDLGSVVEGPAPVPAKGAVAHVA